LPELKGIRTSCRSALGGGHDGFAVEVFKLPPVDGMMVGYVECGILDALQGAADCTAETHAEERAVGDDEDTAAAELLGQLFECDEPPACCFVFGLGASEASGDAQGLQFRAGLQALRGPET